MDLAVVVVSYNSPRTLMPCLASLTSQPEAGEIIVVDCSDTDPSPQVRERFPEVKIIRFAGKRSVPALRWAGFSTTTAAVIATVEARCVPDPNWCSRLLESHAALPRTPAVGGTIEPAPGQSLMARALCFCEYGWYHPPVEPGPVRELSGANVSYKREALDEHAELIAGGSWETQLHARWTGAGLPLRLSSARVSFANSMSFGAIVRQRFAYGRGYAAARFPHAGATRRVLYGFASPLLPFLLTARLGYRLAARGHLFGFLSALPWVLLFNSIWAAGEAAGYLFGPPARDEIY